MRRANGLLLRYSVLLPLLSGCVAYNSPRIDLDAKESMPPSRTSVRDPEWFREQEAKRRELVSELLKQRPYRHNEEYHLSPGDIVSVRVRTVDETVSSSRLDSKGEAALPLLRRINLAGLTIQEAEEKLVAAYEKFYMQPEVEVSVSEYRGRPVSVIGNVERPGNYSLTRDEFSLLDALALAGGFKADSGDRLILIPAKPTVKELARAKAQEPTALPESIAPGPGEDRPSTSVEEEASPDQTSSLEEEAEMLPAEYEMAPLYYLSYCDAAGDMAVDLVEEPESAIYARSMLSDSKDAPASENLEYLETAVLDVESLDAEPARDDAEPLELVVADIDESLYVETESLPSNYTARAQLSDHAAPVPAPEPVVIEAVQIYKEEITGDGLFNPISVAIRPGDSIVVPGQSKVQVLGEVKQPGSVPLTEKMTVMGAIAAAGGRNFASNGTAEVSRMNPDGSAVATVIDLDDASSDPSFDIRLQSGDLVRLPTSRPRYIITFLGEALPKFFHLGAFYQVNNNN